MRLILAVAAILTVGSILPTGDAHAIGAYASFWNSKQLNDGAGFGVKHKVLSIALLSVDVRGGYLRFGDAEVNTFPLEASGLLDLGFVYGGVGLGYYIYNKDVDNSAGSYVLLGGKLALFGTGVFAEAQYRFVGTQIQEIDLDSDGFGFNIGVILFD